MGEELRSMCPSCDGGELVRVKSDRLIPVAGYLPDIRVRGAELSMCDACDEISFGWPKLGELNRLWIKALINKRWLLSLGERTALKRATVAEADGDYGLRAVAAVAYDIPFEEFEPDQSHDTPLAMILVLKDNKWCVEEP